jgi:hypothetical protein
MYYFIVDIPVSICYPSGIASKEDAMDPKLPYRLLDFYEELLSAQLRVVRRWRHPNDSREKGEVSKSMSNIDMVLDILFLARRPLHITEILEQVRAKHGVSLDRESLVSALVKKVHREQGLIRTAPNTFEVVKK